MRTLPDAQTGWGMADAIGALLQTALLIAPAPFFWAPPVWVMLLMTPPVEAASPRRPGAASAKRA